MREQRSGIRSARVTLTLPQPHPRRALSTDARLGLFHNDARCLSSSLPAAAIFSSPLAAMPAVFMASSWSQRTRWRVGATARCDRRYHGRALCPGLDLSGGRVVNACEVKKDLKSVKQEGRS